MASSEKRCLYEVLGLSRDCSADEIRSAYRRLALQCHPDKLVSSGIPEAEATASFQELVNAYEVLSDTKERAWYDSHRNQILFSSTSAHSGSSALVPDLFSFFSNSVYCGYSDSGLGFYKVYGDLFDKIYANELSFAKKLELALPREAPVIGNLESPYVQVTAFYNYWLGFSTVLDFFWVDEYDAMAGPNRKSRRKMDDENKKLRKKAKRAYHETVRGLAEFVKKRDKRIIDMQLKRSAEMERKRVEERIKKEELEREKAEKARNYEEPEWAKVEEIEDEEVEDVVGEKRKEFYCVVCSKKFKSDKQWRNHEQSKKHKDKMAELKEAFSEDNEYETATEGNKSEADEEINVGSSVDDLENELGEQFQGTVGIQDDSDHGQAESSIPTKFTNAEEEDDEEEEEDDANNNSSNIEEVGSDDNEASIFKAMLSGYKSTNKLGNRRKAPTDKVEDSDELEYLEYNDTKGSRRNRGGRKPRGKRQDEEKEQAETMKTDVVEKSGGAEEYDIREPCSQSLPDSLVKRADHVPERKNKRSQQAAKKKDLTNEENASKQKVAVKGRKQKQVAANGSDNTCEKCGEQFETRNKLHKHLGETGHASLRSR